ncbi:MAG: hypothetical protein KF799_10305 [Bdellovibrionales bacterium]|nr:hypothetical protein [Bdellovibrionales bacterium]
MDDKKNQVPNNVIQFPGLKRKESESVADHSTVPPVPTAKAAAAAKPKKRSSKKNLAGTVLAIILATGAVNRYAFQNSEATSSATMASNATVGRGLASVNLHSSQQRDSAWEKELAESLASPVKRAVAAIQVGRPATIEEKLRWGTLEEKYTITFRQGAHEIDSILLQNAGSSAPSYILNRNKFLNDYGGLMAHGYTGAKLKSIQTVNDKTIEAYALYGQDEKPKAEARFELDQHKRLLSLKVEPTQL